MYNGQTKTFALIGLLKYNIYSGNHAYYSYVDTYYYLLQFRNTNIIQLYAQELNSINHNNNAPISIDNPIGTLPKNNNNDNNK